MKAEDIHHHGCMRCEYIGIQAAFDSSIACVFQQVSAIFHLNETFCRIPAHKNDRSQLSI